MFRAQSIYRLFILGCPMMVLVGSGCGGEVDRQGDSMHLPAAVDLDGYYSLSLTRIDGLDSVRVRGSLVVRAESDSTFGGTFSFPDASTVGVASGRVSSGVLRGREMSMLLGSPGASAHLVIGDTPGLLEGEIRSQEFGVESAWPATAALLREDASGSFLFELSYQMQGGAIRGLHLGHLEVEDVGLDSLRVTGSLSEFRGDTLPQSPMVRVGDRATDVNSTMRLDSDFGFDLILPLGGLSRRCAGEELITGSAPITGSCTFGAWTSNEIDFTAYRAFEGVRVHDVNELTDTLVYPWRPDWNDGLGGMRIPLQRASRFLTPPDQWRQVSASGLLASISFFGSPNVYGVSGLREIVEVASDSTSILYVTPDGLFRQGAEARLDTLKRFERSDRFGSLSGLGLPKLHRTADAALLLSYRDSIWEVDNGRATFLAGEPPMHGRTSSRILRVGRWEGRPWVLTDGMSEEADGRQAYLERWDDGAWVSRRITPDNFSGLRSDARRDTIYSTQGLCLSGQALFGSDPCPRENLRTELMRVPLDGTTRVDTISVPWAEVRPGLDGDLYASMSDDGHRTVVRLDEMLQPSDTLYDGHLGFGWFGLHDWQVLADGRLVLVLQNATVLESRR